MSEEKIIKDLKKYIAFSEKEENFNNSEEYLFNYDLSIRIQAILDLYNKEKEKNKELEKENSEIREWKYVIDTCEDLDKLKELDLIKIKGKEYISKDKIREKIQEDTKIIEHTILGGRRNGKTLEYGKRLGRIEMCEELLKED